MSSITLDVTRCFLPTFGITSDALQALAPRLEAIRDEVWNVDLPLFMNRGNIPATKQPLDAAFTDLPDRLLADFRSSPATSELGQILAAAKQLADKVERVVVLGIGGSYMGARALLESCAAPYFNELSRAARGSWPQIYFEGNNVDNDATAGLLRLLNEKDSQGKTIPWGIVVISKSGGTLETAASLRIFLRALRDSVGSDDIADRLIPVTANSGKLFELANSLSCKTRFEVPDGVGGRFSILSAVGLLPAALMGLDIVKLLEGAAAMNQLFRTASAASNPVLQYVGTCHLLEQWRSVVTRVMSVWSKGLEAAGLWYDQLLAESLGKDERGALPLTVVNTRDLHSRAQQHQEGRRDKVFVNVIVQQANTAPLPIGKIGANQDSLDELSNKSLVDVMAAAIAGTNQAYEEDHRPTMDLRIPKLDPFHMGQFFQMLMLATVVEGRLLDINPYGQPGVESYKKNMNRHLRA